MDKKVYLKRKIDDFIEHTVAHINQIQFQDHYIDAIDQIVGCKGKVIFTGLGKAGHAAKKSASLFSSLGIPSAYLNPAEASHGDVGLVDKEDVVIAFSTSGKTREVLETLELVKTLGVKYCIAVTSHIDATIRKKVDTTLDMGEITEAGYLNMAPTTSIIVMLTIADILATCSAEIKGFQLHDYAIRHHAGYLGAKARGEDTSSSSY